MRDVDGSRTVVAQQGGRAGDAERGAAQDGGRADAGEGAVELAADLVGRCGAGGSEPKAKGGLSRFGRGVLGRGAARPERRKVTGEARIVGQLDVAGKRQLEV